MIKKIWEDNKHNFIRFLKNSEYFETDNLDRRVIEENLSHMVNIFYQVSKQNEIDLVDLYKELEASLLNKIEKFHSVQNMVVFISALAKFPALNNIKVWEKFGKIVIGKLDNLKLEDVISLAHAISKNKQAPRTLLPPLEEKFVKLFESLRERQVEKLAIFSQTLANTNQKSEKFGQLAIKYLESNLDKISNPIDVRFLAQSLNRLEIRSKTVFERLESLLSQYMDGYNMNNLKQIIFSTKNNDLYSPKIYKDIVNRISKILEQNDNSISIDEANFILTNCRRWKIDNKNFVTTELAGKLKDIAGIYP